MSSSHPQDWPRPEPRLIRRFSRLLKPLALYHRYSVVGLDCVPRAGRTLLVVNHSLATYDALLLGVELYERLDRDMYGLGDDLIFRIGPLGVWAPRTGVVPASPDNARLLLEREALVGVAPGGMWEALRPSHERHTLRWHGREGFLRLAICCQAPIVLAACPRADEIFTVYPNPLTEVAYRRFKVPLPIFRGIGPTLLPRPVQLTHYLSGPHLPPPYEAGAHLDAKVHAFGDQVRAEMQRLMKAHDPAI
jgi:1-acyl-sn-glycerol-3-phosphate acyltransferase